MQMRLHSFEELTVWNFDIPGQEGRCAVLPPRTARPNPLVVEDQVVASVFSPGQICAVDRATGGLRWRLPLPQFGVESLLPVDGLLYGGTHGTLMAVAADTGAVVWEFQPSFSGAGAERIYSSPEVSGEFLFIGDRGGRLHCLDRRSGKVRWSRLTSRHWGNQVNCTPVAVEDRVYAATNAGLVLAYDASTGRQIWRTEVHENACTHLVHHRGRLFTLADRGAMYALSPETGEILQETTWPGMEPSCLAASADSLAVALEDVRRWIRIDWLCEVISAQAEGEVPSPEPDPVEVGSTRIVALRDGAEAWSVLIGGAANPSIRFDDTGEMLCQTSLFELVIREARTGAVLARLRSNDSDPEPRSLALPSITDTHLYLLTDEGTLRCLRSPFAPGAPPSGRITD